MEQFAPKIFYATQLYYIVPDFLKTKKQIYQDYILFYSHYVTLFYYSIFSRRYLIVYRLKTRKALKI